MGLKLEIFIVVLIVAILSGTYMVELKHEFASKQYSTKEMEFTNTTFTEVNTASMQSTAFSTYGIKDADTLSLDNIKYHTENIQLLRAKKGIYKGDILILDGNITINQKEGFDYMTQHAIYNKKTKILNISTSFIATMNKNIIYGDTLRYDMETKEAFAEQIDATIYTTEK